MIFIRTFIILFVCISSVFAASPSVIISRKAQTVEFAFANRTVKTTFSKIFNQPLQENSLVGYTAESRLNNTTIFVVWMITPLRGDIDRVLIEGWECQLYNDKKVDSKLLGAKFATLTLPGIVSLSESKSTLDLEIGGIEGLGIFGTPQKINLTNAIP